MHLNQFQKQIVQMLFAMIILVIASLIRIIRPENLYWNIVLVGLYYIYQYGGCLAFKSASQDHAEKFA